MTYKLLKKGLEIELYAGTEAGEVLPLSNEIKENFPDFSQEPDQRNFEYITNPCRDYVELFKEIIQPRIKIRSFLKKLGNDISRLYLVLEISLEDSTMRASSP